MFYERWNGKEVDKTAAQHLAFRRLEFADWPFVSFYIYWYPIRETKTV